MAINALQSSTAKVLGIGFLALLMLIPLAQVQGLDSKQLSRANQVDARLLASAYASCLDLAEQHQVKSIAFPSLSTGVYGYPLELAAPIALRTVIEHIQQPTSLQQVMFVLFGDQSFAAFEKALNDIIS